MGKTGELEQLKALFTKSKEQHFDFDLIGKYFRNKDHANSFHTISDKTCNDLDFEELFMFADRTTSKVGQQFLYNKLRNIPIKPSPFDLAESKIDALKEDTKLRIKTQKQLEKLKKDDAYYITSLFQEEQIKAPKWFSIIQILSFSSLLLLILIPFNTKLIIPLMAVVIANLIIHYWNKRNIYQYLNSVPQLLRLKKVARQLYKEPKFKDIDPNLDKSLKTIDQVRNRMSVFQLEANMQGDLEAILWMFLELIKIIFLLEPLLLFGILAKLNSKRKEIEDVFCFVGEIDSLISIASLREGLDSFCIPKIHEDNTPISCSKIYHPLITDCITNDLTMRGKSILLTGSNMSGKTTFIRTIGLNIITGLTLNTCFAKEMDIPRVRLHSAIRISDDLMNDKSYYFEEVSTIKEMIDQGERSPSNLFLLDELFKGTNTIERISAGKAVLSNLNKNNNIVFVSTHDIELTDLLSEEYELYHFSEIVDENTIDFDYKLKEGKLQNRNAIRILQINNYPEALVQEAIEIAKKLDLDMIKS